MIKILLSAMFFVAGCSHTPTENINAIQAMPEAEYAKLVKDNTRRTDQYSGFYQTFQADVTILNTEVTTANLKQRGHFLQWDEKQYQTEREKTVQEASAYAKFFLRFFSPENDYDDFHKGKTIWKVYLEYSGSRFEGKVKKMSDKFIELQTVFPHIDRFSTPYEITFNVPMTTVETGPAKVVITSSLGTAEFKFPGAK